MKRPLVTKQDSAGRLFAFRLERARETDTETHRHPCIIKEEP